MVYWLFNFFNYIIFCLNIRIIARELVQIVSWSNFDTKIDTIVEKIFINNS